MKRKLRHHSLKTRSRNKAWKALSREIREQKCQCEICGCPDNLVVHHLLAKRQHPAFWLERMNLVCCCRACHWRIHHGFEWEFMKWLKESKPSQFEWVLAHVF